MLRYVSRLLRETGLEFNRVVLGLFEENPSASVLDCGCGDGNFTIEIAHKIDTADIHGVDLWKGNVDKACAKGIDAHVCDLNIGLSVFGDNLFNVVSANQVIEHLYNTDTFLSEVYRVLKPGGYFVVSTPNLASFHNILYLLAGKQPFWVNVSDEIYANTWHPMYHADKIGGVPSHYRAFTAGALRELVEYRHFTVEKHIGSGMYPFPVPIARVLANLDGRHTAITAIKARK